MFRGVRVGPNPYFYVLPSLARLTPSASRKATGSLDERGVSLARHGWQAAGRMISIKDDRRTL